MRLDKAVYERGLARSRSRAAMIIADGGVSVNGKSVNKPALDVSDGDEIKITDTIGYVGRGGLKLKHALEAFNIDCLNKSALDIGASTGGFTQCLLENGAESVCAVDVGHGQLAESLRNDSRVTSLENTNARFLTSEITGGKKDIVVMDVSFISQTALYPAISGCLREDGLCVALVKPQFEAGSKFLDKRGVIKDKRAYSLVFERIAEALHNNGFRLNGLCASPILGGDGNKEFLILFSRGGDEINCLSALKRFII